MKQRIISLLVCVIFAGWAQAQELKLDEGVRSISLSGGLDTPSFAGTSISLTGGYGTYFQPLMELGGRVHITENDFITRASLQGYMEYNFDTGESYWIPLVGGVLGLGYLDNFSGSEMGLEFGMYAGMKYYLRDDLALVSTIELDASTGDTFDDEKDGSTSTNVSIDLGIRWYY